MQGPQPRRHQAVKLRSGRLQADAVPASRVRLARSHDSRLQTRRWRQGATAPPTAFEHAWHEPSERRMENS
eukprot:6174651-Pleurochrysis_carterae.AAC.1